MGEKESERIERVMERYFFNLKNIAYLMGRQSKLTASHQLQKTFSFSHSYSNTHQIMFLEQEKDKRAERENREIGDLKDEERRWRQRGGERRLRARTVESA